MEHLEKNFFRLRTFEAQWTRHISNDEHQLDAFFWLTKPLYKVAMEKKLFPLKIKKMVPIKTNTQNYELHSELVAVNQHDKIYIDYRLPGATMKWISRPKPSILKKTDSAVGVGKHALPPTVTMADDVLSKMFLS
jgi:hypothetical protein